MQWLQDVIKNYGVFVICVMWKLCCGRNKYVFEGEIELPLRVAIQAEVLCNKINREMPATLSFTHSL